MATTKPKPGAADSAQVDKERAVTAESGQTLATPGAADQPDDSASSAPSVTSVEDLELCDVRVLAPVTICDVRYQPNTVLEGVPLALVEAHLGSVDPHPEAVAYARANDGAVVQYQGSAQEEDEALD